MQYLKYLDETSKKKKKKRSISSPLYSHQLSRFVASPHKHTAIGAITQLSQGGVTIHHLSQDGFISLLTFLIHTKEFWKHGADSSINFLSRFPSPSAGETSSLHLPLRKSSVLLYPGGNIVSWAVCDDAHQFF